MSVSLKGQNNLALYALMAMNLAVYCTVVRGGALLSSDWIGFTRNLADALLNRTGNFGDRIR